MQIMGIFKNVSYINISIIAFYKLYKFLSLLLILDIPLSHSTPLQTFFETLPIHTNCLHLNSEYMMILCFYHNFYQLHVLYDILIPFCTINNISTSVNNYNFISAFFKYACHTNLLKNAIR